MSAFENRQANPAQTMSRDDYTWAADAAGRPYIGTVKTTLDPNDSVNRVSKTTAQSLDATGNVTALQQWDYGIPTTWAATRSYSMQMYAPSSYASLYIFNRLQSATLRDANGNSANLVSNTYDSTAVQDLPSITNHDANYSTSYTTRGNVTARTTPTSRSQMFSTLGGTLRVRR